MVRFKKMRIDKIILHFKKFPLYSHEYTYSKFMKIKDPSQKKRVGDRLRRIEWQIRGVVGMIENEESVKAIIQQIAAIRSALGSAANEEILCVFEKTVEKKASLDTKEYDEIRELLKLVR